ncbi:unnamed protein product [Candida parapsilosis]|uniref:Uncharacterized protein n=1 Tax=Candida parapsilosis (strain CDC 317 / ATCC MYA-4646) TaxID=578454 RepID=G8BFY2_CANPC|nr:uncharacterized protein CPAR2_204090 [Candida parapsilosis]CAD1808303.1 unnamed protein product [Candida parapsilosis]CCE42766.1 hypothetical protein CPAR2_204090 [Candida parapsilosis]
MKFLILTSDVNQPYVIPNVSPVSSPNLEPINGNNEHKDFAVDRRMSVIHIH